jgi:FKBP-type peptidyl-prolyl cis-trans isomerase
MPYKYYPMKLSLFFLSLLLSTSLLAQSKKTLLAQVDQLKREADQLRVEVVQLKTPKEIEPNDTLSKVSYGLGTLVASNLKMQGGDSLQVAFLLKGIEDVFLNKKLKMEQQEALPIVQSYMQQAGEKRMNKVKADNAAFLEANKTNEGVKTTASGLQYKVIQTGKGKAPLATDKVTVHYTGKLIDGSVFDSSVERNDPVTFEVNGVIPGWTEALQLMHEGDKWILYLPQDIAYGERGAGEQIPPYSTLIFEVELIKVN